MALNSEQRGESTIIESQDILLALEENLDKIRGQLGPAQWPGFRDKLVGCQGQFSGIAGRNELELAADSVWEICLGYPFVRDLVKEYGTVSQMTPPAPHSPPKMSASEVANRFQSLLVNLKEQVEAGEKHRSKDVDQSV